MQMKIKRVRENALLPVRASSGAAAFDLHVCLDEDIVILPGQYKNLPTGIAIELPAPEYVALIFSRSGHGAKHGVSLVNSVGVIDSDYRGEIQIGLINHGSEPLTVCNGDRVAQMMITTCFAPQLIESDSLSETERGAGGFGSTGVR